MMRISAYEAFSFFASCKATAPRFSRSGLGLVEPCGAANRRVASAAAVLDPRNARLVSPLVSMGIPSRNIENYTWRAGKRICYRLHTGLGVELNYARSEEHTSELQS